MEVVSQRKIEKIDFQKKCQMSQALGRREEMGSSYKEVNTMFTMAVLKKDGPQAYRWNSDRQSRHCNRARDDHGG